MERESADEWVDSYLGMLEFYNQKIRPWYFPSICWGIIRIWFVLRLYWLLPWLSKTHRQLEELTRHNMILSTTSTSIHRSLEFYATYDYFHARVSRQVTLVFFVTLDWHYGRVLTFGDTKLSKGARRIFVSLCGKHDISSTTPLFERLSLKTSFWFTRYWK